MKKVLEKLWSEYLWEDCAVMETNEERALAKKAVDLHREALALLNEEQEKAVERYLDALSDTEALYVRKAFFKGCKFAVAFLVETERYG